MNLLQENSIKYARSIYDKGEPLDKCIGFIDVTKIKMCRLSGENRYQRSCYSGHKRVHGLTYQTITTPDGLVFALWGPEVGRRYDLTLLRKSGWKAVLEDGLLIQGSQYHIYCDPAYLMMPYMQVPFIVIGENAEQKAFSKKMSAVRVSVEWSYKDVKQMWSCNDFARKMKVKESPISLMYIASVILFNFRTCLYGGGQTGSYFSCEPPTLDTYVNA